MPHIHDYSAIDLFKFLDQESQEMVDRLFTKETAKEGDYLLKNGEEVPGLFVILKGEVEVKLDNIDQSVDLMSDGDAFGEMSLISSAHSASANILVSSEKLIYLFCTKSLFLKSMQKSDNFSKFFYKGAAILLASRMRKRNENIQETVASSLEKISQIMNQITRKKTIESALVAADTTGNKMGEKIQNVLSLLKDISGDQIDKKIAVAISTLEEVLAMEQDSYDELYDYLAQLSYYFKVIRSLYDYR